MSPADDKQDIRGHSSIRGHWVLDEIISTLLQILSFVLLLGKLSLCLSRDFMVVSGSQLALEEGAADASQDIPKFKPTSIQQLLDTKHKRCRE